MHRFCSEFCVMADSAQIQKSDQNGSCKNDHKDNQLVFAEQNSEQTQNGANCIKDQNALALRIAGIDQTMMQMPAIGLERAVPGCNSA